MPALTDLDDRMKDDPEWRATYDQQLPGAKLVAKRVCLVHVSGKQTRKPFEELISTPPHEIPTSEAPDYCSDETRDCEDVFGLCRSVYFYTGRAHERFGKIALALEPKFENGHTGSASPFDSGGVFNGSIASNLSDRSDTTLRVFAKASEIGFDQWRKEFARFLAAYFSPISDYWTGKPFKIDPEDLFTNTDWRAWVFEVRFCEGHAIRLTSFWCASKGLTALLKRKAKSDSPSPTELKNFLQNVPSLAVQGTRFYIKVFEEEVRRRTFYESVGI